ncbi:DNRLRE domain-containing protein [Nonomuraea sp. NPDC001636]|uniref:DNRLRE domain-containing protein n=1 Tax=Nonomuraea sp. NPDC001636 TaxID=3154391 RepID=UPI0033234894
MLSLMASLTLSGAVSWAQATPDPSAPPLAVPPQSSLSSAQRAARAQKAPAEVADARTEYSTTWANPDGSLTTEAHTAPIRMKRNETWTAIDASLAATNGRFQPRAAQVDLRVSNGGTEPFASMDNGSRSFSVGWNRALPRPTVRGNTATYTEVAPGEDLIVTSLPQGFTHSLVLHRPPSGPLTITLPIRTKGLTLRKDADHGLRLVDSLGNTVISAPAPHMWDSSQDPASGESARQAEVATSIRSEAGGAVLTLRPDPEFLNDPQLRYPVTIDPTSTLTVSTDTWVATNFPDSQRGSTELKAGTFDGGSTVARSYLLFNGIAGLRGKHILDTDLRLWTYWSSTCSTAGSGVQVRRITGGWDPDTVSYGSEPATTTTGAKTVTSAYGHDSGCPAAFTHWDIDAIVQAWADGSANHGVQVRGADQSDSTTWRRYHSANYTSGSQGPTDPALTVTYNSRPTAPQTSVTPDAASSTDGMTTSSLTPTISAKAADSEGSSLTYTFTLACTPFGATCSQPTRTQAVSGVPSGTAAQWTIPPGYLTNATRYELSVTASDGVDATAAEPVLLTTDAADLPTAQSAALDEPANPILSGVVSRPSGNAATAEFFLTDGSGNAVGPTPLGSGDVTEGGRVSLRLPDGMVQQGQTYTWRMRGCVGTACTDKTAPVSFTVPAPQSTPQGQTVTLGTDKLTLSTAKAAADACQGSACPLLPSPTVKIGGTGAERDLTVVSPDLSTIPAGARILSADLKLGAPACTGVCSGTVSAYALDTALPATPVSSDVTAAIGTEGNADAPVGTADLDLAALLADWSAEPAGNHGLALLGADDSVPATFAAPQLVISYLPPGPPAVPRSIRVRAGDAGALVTWDEPADGGSSATVHYDIDVLTGDNQVLKSAGSADHALVVSGLTNGSAYTVRVRAQTPYGTSDWTAPAAVTPQAVAGGPASYLDAVKQYLASQNKMREGLISSSAVVISQSTQGTRFASVLDTQSGPLRQWADEAASHEVAQRNSAVTLSDVLVSQTAADSVTVRATVKTTTTTADGVGTTSEEAKTNDDLAVRDFVFKRQSTSVAAIAQNLDGAAMDASPTSGDGELNAAITGESTAAPADAPAALPLDAQGWPDLSAGSGHVSTRSVKQSGIASWAVDNVYSWPYAIKSNNCTNFTSYAVNKGGKAPEKGWASRTSDNNWFEHRRTGAAFRSYSWMSVNHFYNHFQTKRHRLAWRYSWWDVQPGDVIFFDQKNVSGWLDHLAVVSWVSQRAGVFYAQHGPRDRYRSLSDALPRLAHVYVAKVVK